MKKTAVVLVLALVLTLCFGIFAYAFNNVMSTSTGFTIDESGKAIAKVVYFGYTGVFEEAEITVKIQKQNGSGWTDVESWNETSASRVFSKEYSVNVASGTYRCLITIVASGSGGADDVIEKEYQRTYTPGS